MTIVRPVEVIGLCSARTELTGAVTVAADTPPSMVEAGVTIANVHHVLLSGLTVAPPAPGIVVVDAADVHLSNLEIRNAHGPGVYAGQDAHVEMDAIWIHDLEEGPTAYYDGVGIFAENGAVVIVEDVLVDKARTSGVLSSGDGTQVHLSDAAILDTQLNGGGPDGFGVGMRVKTKGTMSAQRVLLRRNRAVGLFAQVDTEVEAQLLRVDQTQPNALQNFGMGMQIQEGAHLRLYDSVVADNREYGILVSGWGTQAEMDGVVIAHTLPGSDGNAGQGLQANSGAQVDLIRCLAHGNTETAIVVGGGGTRVGLEGAWVRDTRANETSQVGGAVQVAGGAMLEAVASLLEENDYMGMRIGGTGTLVSASGLVVRNAIPGATDPDDPIGGKDGVGIYVLSGAGVLLSRTLLESNTSTGLRVLDAGSQVEMEACTVRNTLPDLLDTGPGVMVGKAARVTISGSLLEGNTEAGIMVYDSGTEVDLGDSVVRDTQIVWGGLGGAGISVGLGAQASVSACLVERNNMRGIQVGSPGTVVDIDDTVIRDGATDNKLGDGVGLLTSQEGTTHIWDSLIDNNVWLGLAVTDEGSTTVAQRIVVRGTQPHRMCEVGVIVLEGAYLLMEDFLVDRNSRVGVTVKNDGSLAELTRGLVRDTQVGEADGGADIYLEGRGIVAHAQGSVLMSDCVLDGNASESVVIAGSGSTAEMVRTVVRRTLPLPNGDFGSGVQVGHGAFLKMAGCLLELNRWSGLISGVEGARAEVTGCVIRDTLTNENEGLGAGVTVAQGSELALTYSLILDNATAGMLAYGDNSTLDVSHSAILSTQEGGRISLTEGKQVFGDGIVSENAQLVIDSSIVMENRRSGVFYAGGGGSIANSLIAGNQSYGLALEKAASEVQWQEQGNYIFGNCMGLADPKQRQQVTTSPGELPIPDAPSLGLVGTRSGE